MAFDKETRNSLAKAVTACRRLLMADVTDQLRGTFGMHPDGTVLPLKDLRHLTDDQRDAAQALRDLLDHYAAAAAGTADEKRKSAYERMVLEIAFTNLNRLAALRMCEERGLVLECVRKGPASDGFRMYESLSGGALGTRFETYRLFLASLCDELAIDLGILFDRTTPQSAVFPTERCLEEVLAELNKAELAQLWKEDETIGWVYQYFNPSEERKEMRKAAAPRNSRELAVRNQFFTPRYVVEFLTDNTLGRIWYEMRQGVTGLKEQCRYLVRRPDEVFLGHMTVPGPDGYEDEGTIAAAELLSEGTEETFAAFDAACDGGIQRMICTSHAVNGYARHAPGMWEEMEPIGSKLRAEDFRELSTQDILDYLFLTCRADRHGGMGEVYSESWFVASCNEVRQRVLASRNEDLPQEQLLRQPVFVPYRAKKDPRDLKILDPACGSGHFLLYCFDLLLLMYVEAWEDSECPKCEATGTTLREDYATADDLCRAAPELILRWNLHGIDIDPRAVQIAALALWLRAQRAWQEQHMKAADRPQVTKSNIVVAEPMPGEEDMRREFIESLRPRVLGQLVEAIFDKMKLAGEAGSLLRIEEEIRDVVADAKAEWLTSPQAEQEFLFPELKTPQQLKLRFDLAGVTDAAFWDEAEEQIMSALGEYAQHLGHKRGLLGHLFVDDAARGFAFIDVCRKPFDVVLMNPPFGEVATASRSYLYPRYASAPQDIFAAFVELGLIRLVPGGCLGAITSRLAFYLELLEDWRRDMFGESSTLIALADLGYGVLDAALVEAAAYIVQKSRVVERSMFLSALDAIDKEAAVTAICAQLAGGAVPSNVFAAHVTSFSSLPASRAAYWVTETWRRLFSSNTRVESVLGFPFVGLQTGDDAVFLRLVWEVPSSGLQPEQMKWVSFAKGGEYSPVFGDYHLVVNWTLKDCARRRSNEDAYLKPGITFTERTTSNLSARVLPPGCAFSPNGVTITPEKGRLIPGCLLLNSRTFQFMVEMCVGGGDAAHSGSAARHYGPRIVASIPLPELTPDEWSALNGIGTREWALLRDIDAVQEESRYFSGLFPFSDWRNMTLADAAESLTRWEEDAALEIIDLDAKAESLIQAGYGLTEQMRQELRSACGIHPTELPCGRIAEDVDWRAHLEGPVDALVDEAARKLGNARWTTKKAYIVNRRLEMLAALHGVCPSAVVSARRQKQIRSVAVKRKLAERIFSYVMGCLMGRWEMCLDTSSDCVPSALGPFDLLPTCPPQMCPAGQKHSPRDVSGRAMCASYDGILVDDAGMDGTRLHQDDIVIRVRGVLTELWGDAAQAIEEDGCEVLGVTDLGDYFRRSSGFFADHLKRYAKSRRQAPIYWPLSTALGSYTLWVYYHRLSDQTLYTAVNKYLEPKIDETKRAVDQAEREQGKLGGREGATQRDRLDEARALLGELEEMREELLRIAGLPYKPNLNDGVIINAAPLHKLFRHRQWAKEAADAWKSLEKGEYDWSHMAYTIWPERVKKVCKKDLSIAIAHGLEDLYEGPKPGEKKERKPRGKKASNG